MKESITVEQVLTPKGWLENQTITADSGKIVSISDATSAELSSIYNGKLIPGYFDTQVNGGGGVLFNHSPSAAIVETMALAHLRFGTTSMLPTIITDNASHGSCSPFIS